MSYLFWESKYLRSITRRVFGLRDIYVYWIHTSTTEVHVCLLDIRFYLRYASLGDILRLDIHFDWIHTSLGCILSTATLYFHVKMGILIECDKYIVLSLSSLSSIHTTSHP